MQPKRHSSQVKQCLVERTGLRWEAPRVEVLARVMVVEVEVLH